jgi:superfamily II DNA/RNA helicase
VSHVFNFDVPIHAEDYVHRIGRTGRAGRSGASFTLVCHRDRKYLDAIEKLIDRKIEWLDGDVASLPPSVESAGGDERKDRRERTPRKGRNERTERPDRVEKPRSTKSEGVTPEPRQATVNEEASVSRPARSEAEKTNRAPRGDSRPYPANDDHRERRQRNHRRNDDDGPTPVGFGDDIPAFMLIVANSK